MRRKKKKKKKQNVRGKGRPPVCVLLQMKTVDVIRPYRGTVAAAAVALLLLSWAWSFCVFLSLSPPCEEGRSFDSLPLFPSFPVQYGTNSALSSLLSLSLSLACFRVVSPLF